MGNILLVGVLATASTLAPALLVGTIDSPQGLRRARDTDGKTTMYFVNGLNSWATGDEVSSIVVRQTNNQEYILRPISNDTASIYHRFDADDTPHRVYITNAGPPVCLGGISLDLPSGGRLSINGNLGKICGAKSYEGQYTAFETEDPSCTWIDHEDPALSGLTFDLVNTDLEGFEVKSASDLCGAPFIIDKEPKMRVKNRRTRGNDFTGMLVKSKLAFNSAARLCNNEASMGPDFVSFKEGLYCDMEKKELHPICSELEQTGCFNAVDDVLVGGSNNSTEAGVSERAVQIVKTYKHVDVWE